MVDTKAIAEAKAALAKSKEKMAAKKKAKKKVTKKPVVKKKSSVTIKVGKLQEAALDNLKKTAESPRPKKAPTKKKTTTTKKPTAKKKPGRPTLFTQKLSDIICEWIALGQSLKKLCRQKKMPNNSTVMRWLANEEYAEFRDQYARARAAQADSMVDDMLDIADEKVDHSEQVQRNRLRIDTRKWLASKMKPKKYGDKVDLEIGGKEDSVPVPIMFVDAPVRTD